MTVEKERIKEVLKKSFCLMEIQAKNAKANGEAVMEKEDMIFLLSQQGIVSSEIFTFKGDEDSYQSPALFDAIKEAVDKGFKGISMYMTLQPKDATKIKSLGYFIDYTGYGSSKWDDIYFSEEAYLQAHISAFQNLFGSIADVHSASLI